MSQTITLAGPTEGIRKLHEAFEFGPGPALNGLTDTAHAASERMGGMLTLMRDLHEARVVELREKNLTEAAEERAARGE
ncbi:hypothetical protein GCM10018980_51670 [Streptomyces capoamus]|uniref:Uncharacterized protein n=1 Tax=Streptomyces capoamus TaxID=68183 RepID=A0A919EZL6_9ACTN|nr:hypothetical protein [Streptomyces capoamus]GGW15769.1 hypothetical protein GCM10010501_29140 [Streptomyces libani subsp. rufus]GHG62054.1 hypothetical protein GCM10018980_51670 [Streptomyces capoamus]